MSYDEPEFEEDPMERPIEGKEVESAQGGGFRLTIEASQWDETRISNAVLARVTENIAAKLQKAIDAQLAQAVSDAVDRVVDAKILEQAEVILREGWTETDSYGHPKKKVTFAERVHGLLSRSDSYRRHSYLDEVIKNLVDEALAKQLKPEIDAAKLKVQQLLDGVLATKLLQAMKEGVGLR